MVAVEIKGGLGNQLFQYAYGVNLADRNKTTLALDISWYTKHFDREFLLNYFFDVRHSPYSKIMKLFRRRSEKTFTFEERLFMLPNNVYVSGYFQSPLYFSPDVMDICEAIRHKLNFDAGLPGWTAVHVRVGDFKTNPINYVLPKSYYEKAFQELNPKGIYVVTDDIYHAKNMFRGMFKEDNMMITSGNPVIDLSRISAFDSVVMANSTFSWWGALTADRMNDAKVICPKKYFSDKFPQSMEDFYPPGWKEV